MSDENSDALNSSFVSASEDERTETNILLSRMSQESSVAAGSGEGLVQNQPINAAGYGTDGGPSSDERPDLPEAKHQSTAFVYLLTFLCAIGGFLFGYDTGIISGAIVLVSVKFLLTFEWQEGVVSAPMATAAIFSLLSGFSNDHFGRKPTILIASFVFTVGALLLAAAQERYMLITGRLILGISIGLSSSTVPMYIAECAPSHQRGKLVTVYNMCITGGQFIASIVAGLFSYDSDTGWRYMFGLAALPAVVQFVGFLFIPDTPRWLIASGRYDKARAVLHRIHGTSVDVEQEVTEIINSVQQSAENQSRCVLWKMLSVGHVRRALIVGCLLQLFQQIVGINTVMYYSATIIKMAGVEDTSTAIWLAAVTALVNFIFTFVGLFLVDRIGRRPLTLGSLSGTMVSLMVLAIGFQLSSVYAPPVTVEEPSAVNDTTSLCSNYMKCDGCIRNTDCGFCYVKSEVELAMNGSCLAARHDQKGDIMFNESAYGRCHQSALQEPLHWAYGFCPTNFAWMATFGLILYLMCFAPGMGPMPWTINSEIYPLWARSTGMSTTTCINWIANLIISLSFLSLAEAITRHGVFWLYASFALIGIITFALCLPETKGKHLEEVEQLFSDPLFSCRRFCSGTYSRMSE